MMFAVHSACFSDNVLLAVPTRESCSCFTRWLIRWLPVYRACCLWLARAAMSTAFPDEPQHGEFAMSACPAAGRQGMADATWRLVGGLTVAPTSASSRHACLTAHVCLSTRRSLPSAGCQSLSMGFQLWMRKVLKTSSALLRL